MRTATIVILSAALVAATGAVWAHGGPPGFGGPPDGPGAEGRGPGPGPGSEPGFGFGLRGLDLSDEQHQKLRALFEGQREAGEKAAEQDRSLHEQLFKLDPAQSGYQAEVSKLADAIGKAEAERIRSGAATRAKAVALLTDAQRAELSKRRAEGGPERRHVLIQRRLGPGFEGGPGFRGRFGDDDLPPPPPPPPRS